MINVLIVDDSMVIRTVMRSLLTRGGMNVISSVGDGEKAVAAYKELKPDIVVMDIEMPVMDGITALGQMIAFDPRARIIMCSSLTEAGADVTLRALSMGASDYVTKPSSDDYARDPDAFGRVVLDKVKALVPASLAHAASAPVPAGRADAPARDSALFTKVPTTNIALRPKPAIFHKPKILAIGSSTGGPKALFDTLAPLKGKLNIPAVITQHMPPMFTTMLAKHIANNTGIPAVEAEDGMMLEAGQVHVAPGGMHMTFAAEPGGRLRVVLSDEVPVNFSKPSVDVMFNSLIAVVGEPMIGVILTGMGSDGMNASRELVKKNNMLIAQDEKTSVVWGMPGAVAKAGLCHAVVPLPDIGNEIAKLLLV